LEKYSKELERDKEILNIMARNIQQSLLPEKVPEIAGLNITVRYRPMISVGGDFYDFHVHDNGIGALIADVSGHGVSAALIVSVVKMAFWFQKENLAAPDGLFKSMNEILIGNIRNEFVTASYCFIDLNQKMLNVGNAGHPSLLIWKRKRNKLLKLRPFGRILGFIQNPEFEISKINLEAEDRILMYTDGVYESANDHDEQFGVERLEAFVTDHNSLTGEEFADDLIDTVIDWSGGEEKIDDDIALVVIDVE